MKFDNMRSVEIKQENIEVMEQALKLSKVQKEKLPLIIESIKEILVEVRKLNDIQINSKISESSELTESLIIQSLNISLLLEGDLQKDLIKYKKDLLQNKQASKGIEQALELYKKDLASGEPIN